MLIYEDFNLSEDELVNMHGVTCIETSKKLYEIETKNENREKWYETACLFWLKDEDGRFAVATYIEYVKHYCPKGYKRQWKTICKAYRVSDLSVFMDNSTTFEAEFKKNTRLQEILADKILSLCR